MLIYSGHDGSLCAEEMYMIKFFGLNVDNFIYTTYASQLAFEVTRDENKSKNINYSSYKVTFYVNDYVLVETNFEEFKNIVEKNSWSKEEIDEYCDGKKEENKKPNSNSIQIHIIIGLSSVAFVLIIIIIFMVIKLKGMKRNKKASSFEENENNKGLINGDEE